MDHLLKEECLAFPAKTPSRGFIAARAAHEDNEKMKIQTNKNRLEIESIMLFFPLGIPVAGLKRWTKGEPEHYESIRGRVDGATMSSGLEPEAFRKLARNLIRAGQAEIVDGLFKLKGF